MAEKQPHTQTVRVLYIPDCKMVSSGAGFFGEQNFTLFDEWFSKQTVFPGYIATIFYPTTAGRVCSGCIFMMSVWKCRMRSRLSTSKADIIWIIGCLLKNVNKV